jgi:hypothetical protein
VTGRGAGRPRQRPSRAGGGSARSTASPRSKVGRRRPRPGRAGRQGRRLRRRATPSFTGQPGVINGASELLGKTAFGDAGVHARSALGVSRRFRSTPPSRSRSSSPSATDAGAGHDPRLLHQQRSRVACDSLGVAVR